MAGGENKDEVRLSSVWVHRVEMVRKVSGLPGVEFTRGRTGTVTVGEATRHRERHCHCPTDYGANNGN